MKKTVKTLKALSDPTRLRIVMVLLEKDLCVCELMFILDMEQSRISHQLRILRDAELVEDIRDGKWIVYTIPNEIRQRFEPLLGPYFGVDLHQSNKIKQDRANLKICLKKQIRKSQREIGRTGL
jgi:ArsR family transcriptional regulator